MDHRFTKLFRILLLIVGARSQDVFNTMPPPVNTNFSCRDREIGFYADVETNCRVYHTCDDHGNKFTYHCPAETAFRQEALVCDHAHLVDCAKNPKLSGNNDSRKKSPEKEDETYDKQKSSNSDDFPNESRNNNNARIFKIFQSTNLNPAYTRSFRITPEPVSQFSTPKSLNRKQPTFVLSSSVFLRNEGNFFKNTQNNRFVTESSKNFDNPLDLMIDKRNDAEETSRAKNFSLRSSTTTFKPFGAGFKDGNSEILNFGKSKFEDDRNTGRRMEFEDDEINGKKIDHIYLTESKRKESDNIKFKGFEKNVDKTNGQQRFIFDGSNFPYSETLRSMQARNDKSMLSDSSMGKTFVFSTTQAPIVKAGTEFPVHTFTGSLSPLVPNELEDDPYYPKLSTTTEAYYKLKERDNEGNKRFRFSTRRPWSGSVDFVIPEVLPDLNTLDDLVDRRKLFYIPRVKAT